MNKPKFRVYLGHKLTNATPEFLKRMEDLKTFLKENLPECVFLDFLGVTAGTAQDVWIQDIEGNVATCDLFVAFLDEESTGLGMEIDSAFSNYGKPILLLASANAHVSRLPLGGAERHPRQIVFRRVTTDQDVVCAIRDMSVRFDLQSLRPVTFQCFESSKGLPGYGRPDGGRHGHIDPSMHDSGFRAHVG